MSARIHPTAIVEDGAVLGADVAIGPYCLIGPNAVLGDGVVLVSHVTVEGHTTIGPRTQVRPFSALGGPPQSTGYKGEPTRLEIGADCRMAEGVTMNRGTAAGGGLTKVGDRGFYMANAHVAHDCVVGDDCVFANSATLGGHVTVGNKVVFGGLSAVHQFARVGDGAMIGGVCGVRRDILPYAVAEGAYAAIAGLNVVGLRRAGATRSDLQSMRQAHRLFFEDGGDVAARADAIAAAYPNDPRIALLVAFLRAPTKRRFARPRVTGGDSSDED